MAGSQLFPGPERVRFLPLELLSKRVVAGDPAITPSRRERTMPVRVWDHLALVARAGEFESLNRLHVPFV
jgi:hypothetical protein